ncbi:ER membrane protein complex subunit 8-like [Hydra vulgaris]|uniref:ER membrane protein complex subunit 8-like n=1 Tax=Hydra vulgaris TaxID=6087 RepID=A0ABM4DQ52_HYDVU
MEISFSPRSYSKILLHATRYPHKAVNGVLLGVCDPNDNGKMRILDAIPLFHQCLGLAPMLEVALTQIDFYCQRQKINIVGYYQANENIEDKSPDFIAYKIAEKVNDCFKRSILVMLDNSKMDSECKEVALDVYSISDNKWRLEKDWQLVGGDVTLALVSELIIGKTFQSLIDFDNHLDDISQDWLNIPINKLVELTTS